MFGGRLGTTLYIHFIWRWVKSRRHSSAPREGEDEKKAEKNAILRSAERRACGVMGVPRRASPAPSRRLTRRRLDLFAEIGAVEVDKGAASPPAPGTEAWWAAVREAVYALRERGLAQYVWEVEVVNRRVC